VSDGEIV